MLLTPPQARALYEHAVTHRYAILAVNADSPAAIADCLLAAVECDAPVIVETSLWQLTGHSFGLGDPLLGMERYLGELSILASSDRFSRIPVVYHTDHIKGPGTREILRHAIGRGASSISLDSSELSREENIEMLSSLCSFAQAEGHPATLEMEAGVDDGVTSAEEAECLFGSVEKAHPGYLALWAPGVGTQHGLASNPNDFRADAVRQHQELVSGIAGRPIGIALHGSSGLSEEQLAAAVAAGVAKVNWSSESLLLRSRGAREYYRSLGDRLEKEHPDFKATAMDNGVQQFVSEHYRPRVKARMEALGGTGRGGEFIETISGSS